MPLPDDYRLAPPVNGAASNGAEPEPPDDGYWDSLTDPEGAPPPPLDECWSPIDLRAIVAGDVGQPMPDILQRDDLQCLLYRHSVNGIHGDSGTGKGWVALEAVRQQIERGHAVMVVDAEDTATSIVARLRLLGASDDDITRHVLYIRPTAEFGTLAVDRLGLDAVDENHDAEVGPWLRRVARRLADAGPAVLLVDHGTKAADNPLHPSGSKRKRAAIGGASYYVTAPVPLVAGKGGRLRLTCAKDRHGTYARGEHVADLVLAPGVLGGLRCNLYAASGDDRVVQLPVILAARDAVRAAKAEGRPMSQAALLGAMRMKARAEILRGGIDLAVGWGALSESEGPRKARVFTYVQDLPEDPEP